MSYINSIAMQTVISLIDIENIKEIFTFKSEQLCFSESANPHEKALKRMQALQKKYPPKVIPKDINLSDLINEMNT